MGALFLVMFLLAIPSMIFFSAGTELTEMSFRNVVTAASLGNLGSSTPTCSSAKFDLTSPLADLRNPQALVQLSCPFGELSKISHFGQISVSEHIDCDEEVNADAAGHADIFNYYPPDCYYEHFLPEDKAIFDTSFERDCKGKQTCQFKFN